jgi:hypothetical protein
MAKSKVTYYEQPRYGPVDGPTYIPQVTYTYIYNNRITQPYGFAYFKLSDHSEWNEHVSVGKTMLWELDGYFIHSFELVHKISMAFASKEEALQHIRNFGLEWDAKPKT